MKKVLINLLLLLTALTAVHSQWVPQNSHTKSVINRICFATDKNAIAVSGAVIQEGGTTIADGEILVTNDGGHHWESVLTGSPFTFFNDIVQLSKTRFIAVGNTGFPIFGFGYQGLIMISENGGIDWTEKKTDLLENAALTTMSTFLDTNLVAGGSRINDEIYRGVLIKSTDRGETWTEITPDIENLAMINQVKFVNHKIVFMSCFIFNESMLDVALYKSDDGMNTWEKIETPFEFTKFDFISPAYGYICGSYDGKPAIYKTVDGAAHWTAANIDNEIDGNMTDVKIMNQATIMSVGRNINGVNLIYLSTNIGQTWELQTDDSGNLDELRSINYAYKPQMTHADFAYISGGNGKILKSAITDNPTAMLITTDNKLMEFQAPLGDVSEPEKVKIRFSHLGEDIRLICPQGFEAGLEENGEYLQTLLITAQFLNKDMDVFFRFKPTAEGETKGTFQVKNFTLKVLEIELRGMANTTSVEDEYTGKLKLYPNPVKDILNVDIEFDTWKIYSLEGNDIKSGSEKNINLEKLSPGCYFIEFLKGDVKIIKSFVKI